MTPERLTYWIYKICPGSVRLQLVHEQALTTGHVVVSWARAEVDDAKENPIAGLTIAEQLIDAAQEYADNVGEACRFMVQWVGADGRSLRMQWHRAGPAELPGTAESNVHALNAGNVSGNQLTAQLLSHIAQQQKVMNGSIGVILTAYERCMAMQQQMITQLGTRLDALPPPGPDETEFSKAKVRALERLGELAPDIARLAIAAIERAVGGDSPADIAAAAAVLAQAPSNGVSPS